MKKLIIYGYYGKQNVGDDLILYSIVNLLKNKFNISAFSDRDNIVKKFGIKLAPRNLFSIIKNIFNNDILVFGGGGLIQDKTSLFNNVFHLYTILIAKIFRKKVLVLGIGVDPLKRRISKLIVKFILQKADYITVRDNLSKKVLENLNILKNISVITDPVLNMCNIIKSKSKEGDKKYIALSLRPFDNMGTFFKLTNKIENSSKVISFSKQMTLVLKKYTQQRPDIKYKFFVFQKDDLILYNKLKESGIKNLELINILKDGNLKTLISSLNDCDLMIGMRLHSIITASAYDIPTISISHTYKNQQFMLDMNMKEFSLNVNDIISLPKKIDMILNQNIKKRVKQNREILLKRNERLTNIISSLN